MKTRFLPWLVLLALLFTTFPAFAKGSADKITVSGPGLEGAVEITGPESLEAFSPWGDAFFDFSGENRYLPEPPQVERTYEVAFYLEGEIIYVFHYAPDPGGGGGYIYIPDRGEPYFQTNIRTILRGEGEWHKASAAWVTLMDEMVLSQLGSTGAVSPTASPIFASLIQQPWLLALLGGGLVLAVGAWILLRKDRQPA